MQESILNRIIIYACLLSAMTVAGCTSSTSSTSSLESQFASIQATGGDGLREVAMLPAPANTNNGADVLVAVNDLLEVDVFQVDELDKTVRVEANGKISLPLIGAVVAAGRTITDLESEIERLYGARYLQNPEVSVFMKESAGQRITLDGEFTKPGIYASSSDTTLLKASALAGGLTALADEQKLYVFREVGGQRYVANYSIKDIRQGKKADPRIFGGDIVIAFRSGTKVATQNLKEALGIAVSATRLASPI
jgi:polysaccharide export outer membrane protein